MRVAITGAGGTLGRYVMSEMLAARHQIYAIDRILPVMNVPSSRIDIRDLTLVVEALRHSVCDAIIHMAAISSPIGHPPEDVFTVNALGTFNVVEAAAMLGIARVVSISSVSALGVAYATHPVVLRYVPVDEDHPLLPQDVYGLSKQVGEDICRTFHRRTGGDAVSLRFPLIWDSQANPDLLPTLSADEISARHTLWSYIDIRDAARACRLAVETHGLGAEVFYVTAPETFMRQPSAELARRHFPGLLEIRGNETGHWSFHSSRRAEQQFGFQAEHRYRPPILSGLEP